MRVVLFSPHHRFGKAYFPGRRVVLPVGLLAVAAPVDAAGYDVQIIDQQIEPRWKKLLLAELEREPLCVGITCMTGPQIRNALEASRLVKESSNVPVVWGGTHPSLLPQQTLENDSIDLLVQGEGEETFLELVQTMESGGSLSGVKGAWYKENGQIKANPPRPHIDLNTQPPLAYHLVDINQYLEYRFGNLLLRTFSSRGCSYQCAFCYNRTFNDGQWRSLTAEETVKRIKALVDAYGIEGVMFCDDNFFGDLRRAKEILEGISRESLNLILYKLDIRPDTLFSLDDAYLRLLKTSGCESMAIGLESGSERVLKLLKKNVTVSQILAINRRLRTFGIRPSYTFMMGYPTETLEELRQTLSLISRLREENPEMISSLNIYTPLPGTELFDLAVQHGLQAPRKLEDWIPFNYTTVNLPWMSGDRRRLLAMLHFCTIFLDENLFSNPKADIPLLFRVVGRLYRPVARWRVARLFHRFPVEMKLAQWLRFYRKQA